MFSFSERKHKCLTIVQPKELSEKLLNDGNNKWSVWTERAIGP